MKLWPLLFLPLPCLADFEMDVYHAYVQNLDCKEFAVQVSSQCQIYAGLLNFREHAFVCCDGLCSDNYIAKGNVYPKWQYHRVMEDIHPVVIINGVAVGVFGNELRRYGVAYE